MLTHDTSGLCVNIPTKEILRITKSLLLKRNDARNTKHLITILDDILQQNYLSFKNLIYQPETGVSEGSHFSSAMAEIFLQNMENSCLIQRTQHSTLHT